MWGVSANIHAVNKRVAGNAVANAVVNMSQVIIRWFYSLRSKATNSKAISNLEKGKAIYWKKEEKSKDLNWLFEDFLQDLLKALVPCRHKHSLFFRIKEKFLTALISELIGQTSFLYFCNHRAAWKTMGIITILIMAVSVMEGAQPQLNSTTFMTREWLNSHWGPGLQFAQCIPKSII